MSNKWYDETLVSIFITPKKKINGNYIRKVLNHKEKYSNVLSYLYNRFEDADANLSEILWRLYYKQEVRNVCPICGKRTKFDKTWYDINGSVYKTYCCASCSAKSEERNEKRSETCLSKYGISNNLLLPDIRNKAITNAQLPDVKEKRKATNIERYGVAYVGSSADVQEKIRNTKEEKYGYAYFVNVEKRITTNLEKYGYICPFQDEGVKKKAKQTWIDKYGCENPMQAETIKEKAAITCLINYGTLNGGYTDIAKEKIKQTCQKRYHTNTPIEAARLTYQLESPFKKVEAQDKASETVLAKYGVSYITQLPEVVEQINATKRKHGTFNTSTEEELVYKLLVRKFGEEQIKRQYHSKEYPFNCDFYINDLDLYIECNFSWTHGGHPYNEETDKDIIEKWTAKHTKYYDNAIDTWTIRDIKKRNKAKENKLNYIEFFTIKEAETYINNIT